MNVLIVKLRNLMPYKAVFLNTSDMNSYISYLKGVHPDITERGDFREFKLRDGDSYFITTCRWASGLYNDMTTHENIPF